MPVSNITLVFFKVNIHVKLNGIKISRSVEKLSSIHLASRWVSYYKSILGQEMRCKFAKKSGQLLHQISDNSRQFLKWFYFVPGYIVSLFLDEAVENVAKTRWVKSF